MLILKGHRFRLDLNEAQEHFCSRTSGTGRFLWNLALEQRSKAWTHGRHSVGYAAQCADLPALKVEVHWLAEAPSQVLQQVLKDLQTAFQNFFAGRASYPAFRKKYEHDSFRFPEPKQFVVDEVGQRIKLPKLGWVAYRNGRGRHALKLQGRPKSITVSREGRHWYASVLCEAEVPEPMPLRRPPVGLDLGVAKAIMCSTGGDPLPILGRTETEDRKIARLQRDLARTKKGSKNRHKARMRLAALQARIAARRRDSIHKATTMLAKNHGLIVIEDLRVKDMTKAPRAKPDPNRPGRFLKNGARRKAGLNKAILDKGWGEIRRQLGYKTLWYGSRLLVVDPAYTSQRCSEPGCGHIEAGNRLDQETFRCLKCGHTENADLNAAKNILADGLAVESRCSTTEGLAVAACGAMLQLGGRRSRKPAA